MQKGIVGICIHQDLAVFMQASDITLGGWGRMSELGLVCCAIFLFCRAISKILKIRRAFFCALEVPLFRRFGKGILDNIARVDRVEGVKYYIILVGLI